MHQSGAPPPSLPPAPICVLYDPRSTLGAFAVDYSYFTLLFSVVWSVELMILTRPEPAVGVHVAVKQYHGTIKQCYIMC